MADNRQGQAGGVPHVVIIGGGIAGLSAAFYLRDKPVRVTVLEASSRVGGKLAVSEVAGVTVDVGADSTYRWRPKTTALINEAGLGELLKSAANTSTAIWTDGRLRSLPRGQFMGVPSDMDELAGSGVLSAAGVARAREDLHLPGEPRTGDVSVAEFVGSRLGKEVVDRLVEPFLVDVFAGRAEDLSFDATLTPLANASRKFTSLARAAGSLIPPPPEPGKQTPTGISTLTCGLGALPGVLAEAILADSPGSAIRTDTTVTDLARTAAGWRLTVRGATEGVIDADAVVVAVPAGPASTLLAVAADAAADLADIPYASTATVTFAYPRSAFPGGLAASGFNGFRVPAVEGRAANEVSFSTVKWPHLAGEVEIIRCAVGRLGDEHWLQRDDADLAAVVASEIADATGAAAAPVASRVVRWVDSLPQYNVGHLDRVARIRASVAAQPGLAVCGAVYDGLGVGNCITSARKAVDQVLAGLPKHDSAAA